MDRACSMHWRNKKCSYNFRSKNPYFSFEYFTTNSSKLLLFLVGVK